MSHYYVVLYWFTEKCVVFGWILHLQRFVRNHFNSGKKMKGGFLLFLDKICEVFDSPIEAEKVFLITSIVIGLSHYRLRTCDMDLLIFLIKKCSNDPHIGVTTLIATNLQDCGENKEDVLDPLVVKVSNGVHTLKKWNKIKMIMPRFAVVFLNIDVWSYLNIRWAPLSGNYAFWTGLCYL